jgi:pyrroloquinoline quinone biosynthesis protein D
MFDDQPAPPVGPAAPGRQVSRGVVPRPADDVSGHLLDGELVLFDQRSGRAFVLNVTGAEVWALCDGRRTLGAVAQVLAERYGLPAPRALADVGDLIDGLERAGLVVHG